MASTTGTRLSTDIQPRAGQCTVWEIDPKHTLVEFGVKHMMFTTVKGRFTNVRGTINCADEADAARASVEAEIDAASVNTAEEQRDAHLRSAEFLDAERYPTMTFKSTRVERMDTERLRVIGDLTIRGVTHEVALLANSVTLRRWCHESHEGGLAEPGPRHAGEPGAICGPVRKGGGDPSWRKAPACS